jgi:hypothetical protein
VLHCPLCRPEVYLDTVAANLRCTVP